jgi:hypothetical protein
MSDELHMAKTFTIFAFVFYLIKIFHMYKSQAHNERKMIFNYGIGKGVEGRIVAYLCCFPQFA